MIQVYSSCVLDCLESDLVWARGVWDCGKSWGSRQQTPRIWGHVQSCGALGLTLWLAKCEAALESTPCLGQ